MRTSRVIRSAALRAVLPCFVVVAVLCALGTAAPAASCAAPATAHVFFVTDRQPASDGQLFTGERGLTANRDAVITRGVIGAGVDRAGERRCASQTAFLGALRGDFDPKGVRRILLYVHGYYTPFRRAVADALAIQKTLHFAGPAIVYSWPSKVTSRLTYVHDENNAGWSAVHFRELLSALLTAYPKVQISFAAHSLGARLSADGIDFIRHGSCPKCLGRAAFFAPDVDTDTLRAILGGAGLCPGRPAQSPAHAAPVTVYVSNKDIALRQSQRLHGHQRAGQAGTEMLLCAGVDTIDVGFYKSSDSLGHSYHVDQRVVDDVRAAFGGVSPANARRKLTRVSRAGGAYYELR